MKSLWLKFKYRKYDSQELFELNEMLVKFGRRVTHDLEHIMSELSMNLSVLEEHGLYADRFLYDRVKEKLQFWKKIFYFDNGGKNYRSEIYREVEKLEDEVEKLKKLCEENGIDYMQAYDVPF